MDRIIIQLAGERGRVVVSGWRTHNRTCRDLLIVHELGGTWALYPHGAAWFGVRIDAAAAAIVREIPGDLPRTAEAVVIRVVCWYADE